MDAESRDDADSLLRTRGFVRDGPVYRAGRLILGRRGRWWILSESVPRSVKQPRAGALGRPGLWKWISEESSVCRVFEFPAWAAGEPTERAARDPSDPAPMTQLLDWALASRRGQVPSAWAPPAPSLVQTWMPAGALTFQARGCVRQVQLILEPGRWALRLPLLPCRDTPLPAARRRLLGELAEEAQSRWAMARIGMASDPRSPALLAEVDFSGAPHSELLFSAGLDSLRPVLNGLVETAEVLADPCVALACLAPGAVDTPTPNPRNAS